MYYVDVCMYLVRVAHTACEYQKTWVNNTQKHINLGCVSEANRSFLNQTYICMYACMYVYVYWHTHTNHSHASGWLTWKYEQRRSKETSVYPADKCGGSYKNSFVRVLYLNWMKNNHILNKFCK